MRLQSDDTNIGWAMQLLSVTVQRGNAEMYRRSGLVISREQGLRYDAGFAVPVLMSFFVLGLPDQAYHQ